MSTTQGKTVMVQGRIVWVSGDLFKGQQKKDHQTKQPMTDKQGQPVIEYGFGLAVPKSSLTENPDELWASLHSEGLSLYPSGQLPPDFAMKFKDGDTDLDQHGVPFSQRTGYPGCVVLACTTRIPIQYFKFEDGKNFQINEGIKCGDYINVQLGIKAHPSINRGKPGLYLNPNAVQLIGFGEAIINTPNGDQIFGGVAPATPQGASATPIAPQAGNLIPQGQPTPVAAPMVAPVMPVQQPVAVAPAPHYAVLPQNHQPAAAPMPAQPPVMDQAEAVPNFAPQPAVGQVYQGTPGLPPMPGR